MFMRLGLQWFGDERSLFRMPRQRLERLLAFRRVEADPEPETKPTSPPTMSPTSSATKWHPSVSVKDERAAEVWGSLGLWSPA